MEIYVIRIIYNEDDLLDNLSFKIFVRAFFLLLWLGADADIPYTMPIFPACHAHHRKETERMFTLHKLYQRLCSAILCIHKEFSPLAALGVLEYSGILILGKILLLSVSIYSQLLAPLGGNILGNVKIPNYFTPFVSKLYPCPISTYIFPLRILL